MSAYVLAEGRVPFAPIPGHVVAMRHRPDDTWTTDETPLRRSWDEAYRGAAYALLYGDGDEARRLARLGRDLEDAYIVRVGAEVRAERAAREMVAG